MMLESCKHNHTAPKDIILTLPDYQAGTGRHRCAICAYDIGYNSKIEHKAPFEDCEHGHQAPLAMLKGLLENQGGSGRHKCVVCAYHQGMVDKGQAAPDIIEDIKSIEASTAEPETVKAALVQARLGQGKFRQDVISIEKSCRVTGLNNSAFLIASHIKPWRKCSNTERLDKYNGLMLSPHIDKLFDTGHLSFMNDGTLLCSKLAHEALEKWQINPLKKVGDFSEPQKKYLEWHRNQYKENFKAST